MKNFRVLVPFWIEAETEEEARTQLTALFGSPEPGAAALDELQPGRAAWVVEDRTELLKQAS